MTDRYNDGYAAAQEYHKAKVRTLTDALEAAQQEGDRLFARIDAVRDLHRRMGIYEPCLSYPEDCPNDHFETEVGEFVHGDDLIRWACETCRDEDGEPLDHPCATITALEDR